MYTGYELQYVIGRTGEMFAERYKGLPMTLMTELGFYET